MALSADTDVFHITGLHIQQATCHNLTLIIKQFVCHNRHAGTGQNFSRVGFFYPGFFHGAYFHERRSLNNFHRDRVITFEQIAE